MEKSDSTIVGRPRRLETRTERAFHTFPQRLRLRCPFFHKPNPQLNRGDCYRFSSRTDFISRRCGCGRVDPDRSGLGQGFRTSPDEAFRIAGIGAV
jgi:hypothetical protein